MEEKKKICCIHRLGSIENHELIRLEDASKKTLGRANTNDICLNEAACISRQHAILEKNENDFWTVMDLNSSNGVMINGEFITPSIQHILKDKDIIEIGKDPSNNDPAVYRFQYHQAVKVKFQRNNHDETVATGFQPPPLKRMRKDNEVAPSPSSQIRQRLAEQERLLREEMLKKEKEAEERVKEMERRLAEKEEDQQKMMQEMSEYKQKIEAEAEQQKALGILVREKEEALMTIKQNEEDTKNRVKELQAELEGKELASAEAADTLLTEKQEVLKQLEEHRKEREKLEEKLKEQENEANTKVQKLKKEVETKETKQEEMSAMVHAMQEEKENLESQMNQQKVQLEEEKEALAIEMQKKLEHELKEQENKLKQQLNDEIEQLQGEKQKVELSLQEEMKKAIEQKDKILEEELKKKQEELTKALTEKEDQLVAEIEKHKESGKKEKHKLVEGIEDLMEEELVCTICSELFIRSMSLNCSHSFCTYCIKEWMLRKMQCPNCRTGITSCVRSIVLDNYIDKMIQYLSDEMKQRRITLIRERKTLEEKQEKAEAEKKKKAERDRRAGVMAAAAAAQPARVFNVLDAIVMHSPAGQPVQLQQFQNITAAQARLTATTSNARVQAQAQNVTVQARTMGQTQTRNTTQNNLNRGQVHNVPMPRNTRFDQVNPRMPSGRNVFAVPEGQRPAYGTSGHFDARVQAAQHYNRGWQY